MTRYLEIPRILTHYLRVLTAEQIARHWFSHTVAPEKIARQFLRRQERNSILILSQAMIHPPLRLTQPLFEWQPGDEVEPNWDAISWQVQSRWNKHPVRALIARATKNAQRLTGGTLGGRAERPLEISHDVTLGELFLTLRNSEPATAVSWTPEDALQDFGPRDKRPDAVIRDDGADVLIELGGKAYSARRLASIHAAYRYRHWRLY